MLLQVTGMPTKGYKKTGEVPTIIKLQIIMQQLDNNVTIPLYIFYCTADLLYGIVWFIMVLVGKYIHTRSVISFYFYTIKTIG